ncbi:hypothetical protein SCHPADRAFT_607323 [Schizopora paradoxa]|uniref:DUF6533 domain-containing protein n=1 Tax=Schizopora paradoxa TaxID=27342 RepID=A0A0H2R9G9_9AGAM|nr:hypothetical protein SCHPADRAFT_607323 [Schizopora paradoxa]
MSGVDATLRTAIDQYYIIASSAFFYYDFALTLRQEIKYIWSSKPTFINFLVIALRYLTVLSFIPAIALAVAPLFGARNGGKSQIRSDPRNRWNRLPNLDARATHDPASRDVQQEAMDPLHHITNCFTQCRSIKPCDWDLWLDAALKERRSLIYFQLSFVATIFFDTFIFFLALVRVGSMRLMRGLFCSQTSLMSILLRDGTILYGVLAISNISNFILFMLFIDGPDAAINHNSFDFVMSSGTNSELTHALSVVFVSRMIFNLREVGTEINEGTDAWRSRVEQEEASIRFRVPTTNQSQSSSILGDLCSRLNSGNRTIQ